jgi:hypothetical protein
MFNEASSLLTAIIFIVLISIIPFGLYVVTLLYPAAKPAMAKHPGIILTVCIAGAFFMIFAFRWTVVDPCYATTNMHTVTDHLGGFYTTAYKDSGEWCIWMRHHY